MLALIASVSGSADADVPLIGLYSDLDHSVTEENGQAMFDVYLWIKPTGQGAMSTELLVTFPMEWKHGLACTGKAYCADMTLTRDDIAAPATGGAIAWANCAMDWKWVARLTFLDMGYYEGSPTVGYIKIEPHPISGEIWIANCT